MATTKIVPCAPALRSMTGVAVTPMVGVTGSQPYGGGGVDRTGLRRQVDDVVHGALHGEPGQVQRLRVHLAVRGEQMLLPEARRVDVGGRQNRLGEILAGGAAVVF